ncbi:hypothetical protein JD844_014268 [Phrynosoma platyrhinos]|uniref:C2 domain-containing protein n=1 Tax=Phrynosoma platyrhinos TaxID=52577 RepID=A0ABQ7SRB1_PHRPL|nr:hypothetical protein JD844_014268 [Phrynosoma platyrhinos]
MTDFFMPAALPRALLDSSVVSSYLWSTFGEAVHLQVFLGVGLALLCFCLLLGCAICWHQRKKNHLDEDKVLMEDRTQVDLGLVLPSQTTTAVAIQKQYVEIEGDVLEVPSTPAIVGSPGSSGPKSPPQNIRRGRASLPSIPISQKLSLPVKVPQARERRCTISGESIVGDERSLLSRPILGSSMPQSYTIPRGLSGAATKPRPHLHFTLFYSQAEALLTVTVIGISRLPKGLRASRNSYVKVYLLPKFVEPQRTSLCRKSLNPEFHEQFYFGRYSLEELQNLTLRFAVYTKEFHNLKDSFLGECFSSQDMSATLSFSQPKSMGQLFVLLQYQALANRIKVLDTKETKSIAGYNPVWNTPFLFSIPAGDIQEQQLALEFTIMQARLCTRSCVVGRVMIGPNAPEMGQVHWKEMCSRGNVESARWHSIQPPGFPLSP